MFESIKGSVSELTPTYIVVDTNGIGYLIHISLHTYSQLKPGSECIVYLHQIIREDAHLLYGFATKAEREMFRLLVSVSGVGASTARVILSSLSSEEIVSAISSGNYKVLQNVKGIGEKTAQRIIVELRDKVAKFSGKDAIPLLTHSTNADEAVSALILLGFTKQLVEKAVNKILSDDRSLSVEDIIKRALKIL